MPAGPGCIHKLDPHYESHPELLEGFHGLKQKSTFVVFAIISAPKNFEQRSIIRQTWLNVPDRKVRSEFLHFFVVGRQDLSDDIEAQLQVIKLIVNLLNGSQFYLQDSSSARSSI